MPEINKELLKGISEQLQHFEQPPSTYVMSPHMLDTLKDKMPSFYQRETDNITQSFFGFAIKEDVNMPDDMMTALNNRGQIIGVMKFEKGMLRYSKIDPDEFYQQLPMRIEMQNDTE